MMVDGYAEGYATLYVVFRYFCCSEGFVAYHAADWWIIWTLKAWGPIFAWLAPYVCYSYLHMIPSSTRVGDDMF